MFVVPSLIVPALIVLLDKVIVGVGVPNVTKPPSVIELEAILALLAKVKLALVSAGTKTVLSIPVEPKSAVIQKYLEPVAQA